MSRVAAPVSESRRLSREEFSLTLRLQKERRKVAAAGCCVCASGGGGQGEGVLSFLSAVFDTVSSLPDLSIGTGYTQTYPRP